MAQKHGAHELQGLLDQPVFTFWISGNDSQTIKGVLTLGAVNPKYYTGPLVQLPVNSLVSVPCHTKNPCLIVCQELEELNSCKALDAADHTLLSHYPSATYVPLAAGGALTHSLSMMTAPPRKCLTILWDPAVKLQDKWLLCRSTGL